jgi:asparagine synthetase B (glutamine-hydrolysing)
MCGICGIVEFDANNHVDEDLLREMYRVTSHGSRL